MEFFAKILSGLQPLTIFTKNSVLEVRLCSEYTSIILLSLTLAILFYLEKNKKKERIGVILQIFTWELEEGRALEIIGGEIFDWSKEINYKNIPFFLYPLTQIHTQHFHRERILKPHIFPVRRWFTVTQHNTVKRVYTQFKFVLYTSYVALRIRLKIGNL